MKQAQRFDEQYVVVDDDGIWWPTEETQTTIKTAQDPEAEAIRLCEEYPSLGKWVS